MRLLAIGAHPDDIEIFMFGFISVCKERKDQIYLAVATDGSAGGDNSKNDLVKKRKKETIKALSNFANPIFLNLKDGELVISKNAFLKIKNLITTIKPDLILTHAPEDYHPDHRVLSKMVLDAASFLIPVLYADTLMGVNFLPDYYVDITKFFPNKEEAILFHESQNPIKFLNATRLQNRFRSAQCNTKTNNYAEAFRMEKNFPHTDIRSYLPNSPIISPYYVSNKDSLI